MNSEQYTKTWNSSGTKSSKVIKTRIGTTNLSSTGMSKRQQSMVFLEGTVRCTKTTPWLLWRWLKTQISSFLAMIKHLIVELELVESPKQFSFHFSRTAIYSNQLKLNCNKRRRKTRRRESSSVKACRSTNLSISTIAFGFSGVLATWQIQTSLTSSRSVDWMD